MNINIDSAIFIGFLIANVVLGLSSGRGIKTITEYAVGDRNFSTATIAATIVATWISGGIFFTIISESYSNGLYFMWAGTGDALCLLVVGYFFAPRLAEFLGKLSIAEAMGELYGKHVRIITAVAGFIGVSGVIAMQFKIAGLTFEYCFGIPSIYGVIAGGVIVTLYSTLGGIKSVTFTDIIQFFTFGTIIPTIAFFILNTLDSVDTITNTLSSNELFDYKQVFDFTEPKAFYYLFLFLYFAIPAFNSAIFQRIAMAKNVRQIRQSFIIAGFTCLFLTITIDWIGILALSIHPNLAPNEVVKLVIFDHSFVGLKGLTLAGIMAMLMSTADSYINSTAVLVVHDFCKPLGINLVRDELRFSRIASLLIGSFSILLSLYGDSILQLALTTCSFYMPVVTVPFIMSTLGFRSSGQSVMTGMGAGLITVILWKMFLNVANIDPIVPGMVANLLALFGSHYLLKQDGGWVGIKDDTPLQEFRHERREKIRKFINSIVNFNFVKFCKKNSPTQEAMYAYFGLFCIISMCATMHSIPKGVQLQYSLLISFIYPSVLFSATVLISYPLWLQRWKENYLISILWNVIIFYVLICISFSLVIISNFAEMQLMVFMINIIVISGLIRWQWMLFMLLLGLGVSIVFLQLYLDVTALSKNFTSLEFKVVYLLLLVSSAIIIFLKPKQEQQELTEEKIEHLGERISDREEELQKSLELKYEFLRNIEHEVHTPITGITSMGQVLHDNYDKFSEKQRRQAVADIANSSQRLNSLTNNLLDLSKLSSLTYELNKTEINFSWLLYDRVEYCKKLYLNDKELEFFTDIEADITINCDLHYITSTIDNLIINAIKYSNKGSISVVLKKGDKVQCSITDEGIAIPSNELYDIFGAFTVSSKTKTPAGGRGVGLALCKKVIEVHGGRIWAESNGKKGAVFKFTLPI